MDNNSPLAALRRRWWIVVLLAFVGAVIGALPQTEQVEEQATRYTAIHTLLQNDATDQVQAALISVSQIPLFASVGEVPARAARQLDFGGNAAELASQMEVSYDFNTGALTVSTTQSSAQRAERYADVYAEVLASYLVERQDVLYQERLASFLERLEELERQLNSLSNQVVLNPNDPILEAQRSAVARQYSVVFEQSETLTADPNILSFTTLQRAQAIAEAQGALAAPTSRMARGLMGGALGAALGAIVAFLLGLLDRRIRTREQVEAILGMRARVLIHRSRDERTGGLVVGPGRHDPLSDSYRTMRNVVGFVHGGLEPADRGRITVVVSPGPGDGKTSMAANLAAAFCELGQRTVVVNTDFRRPRLSRAINGTAVSPSAFNLADLESIDPAWLLRETPLPNMMLLDLAGMGSAGELALATARLLPRLAAEFDAVVVDTSPVAATAEVLEIVPHADVIVMVARLGNTPITAAERAASILRDTTTAPVVLALTGAQRERTGYYEYHDRRGSAGRDGEPISRIGRLRRKRGPDYQGPERRRSERKLSELQVSEAARRSPYRPGADEHPPTEVPRVFESEVLRVEEAQRSEGGPDTGDQPITEDVRPGRGRSKKVE